MLDSKLALWMNKETMDNADSRVALLLKTINIKSVLFSFWFPKVGNNKLLVIKHLYNQTLELIIKVSGFLKHLLPFTFSSWIEFL